jgi:hypothetical protein
MSLSRLWHQQGKRQEAHDLLAEVYGWFTEGFDTADLQEAKAWLEELAGQHGCTHHAAATFRPIVVLAMLSPPYLCDPCTCGVLTRCGMGYQAPQVM